MNLYVVAISLFLTSFDSHFHTHFYFRFYSHSFYLILFIPLSPYLLSSFTLLFSFPQILDGESKVSIANKFAVPGTGGEKIDYAQCFRAYLRQATVRFVPAVIQAVRNSKNFKKIRILNKLF